MYAHFEKHLKAITALSILLLMGLALFAGQSSALATPTAKPPTATAGPAVLAIAIEVNIRQNGE